MKRLSLPSFSSGMTTMTGSDSTLLSASVNENGVNNNNPQRQQSTLPPLPSELHSHDGDGDDNDYHGCNGLANHRDVDDDDRYGLKRVGSRSNLNEWRSEGVVSEGGSVALMERLKPQQKRIRRQSELLSQQQEHPNQQPKRLAYLNSFIKDLRWCLSELNNNADKDDNDADANTNNADKDDNGADADTNHMAEEADMATLERIAIFLDRSLTRESRRYHNVAHVYNISAGSSPLQVLAAFFRDTVKESIDRCDPDQEEHWRDIFEKEEKQAPGNNHNQTHTLRSNVTDSYDLVVLHVFGHVPGQELATGSSLDIFLSALVAARLLKDILPIRTVAQVAACIEATTPFRPKGNKHLETLHKRLVSCNKEFHLGLANKDMELTVQQACDLWNRQVGNMTSKDVAVFLDHTWSLLPEHAKALRRTALYTLSEYHSALIGMDHFMSGLVGEEQDGGKESRRHRHRHQHQQHAKQVFLDFYGIPTAVERGVFRERYERNANIALSYVRARLLSVAVVHAMAVQTGGDGPKSYFFGDVPSLNKTSVNLGEILELPPEQKANGTCNREVLDLLRSGNSRLMDAGFDIRNTGVAAFLYMHLGEYHLQRLLEYCDHSPMTKESSIRLLLALPLAEVVEPILTAFCFMAVTRAPAAESLLTELRKQIQVPQPADADHPDLVQGGSSDQSAGSAEHHRMIGGVWRRVRHAIGRRREHRHHKHQAGQPPERVTQEQAAAGG